MSIFGSLLSGFGSVFGGFEAKRSFEAQAALARQNAELSREQAEAEAGRFERGSRRRLGAIRAQAGASGTTLSGSVLDVLADQAAEEEENRLLILFGGEAQARQSEARAKLLKRQGRVALTTGLLDAAGTLLSADFGSSSGPSLIT